MTTDTPQQLLQQLCADLRLLWTQAGGPTLRTLSSRVRLGKSQVGAILNGRIRRPPDWQVVNDLVTCFVGYAHEHGRTGRLSLSTGVDEYWRHRHAVLEHAFEQVPREVRPTGSRTEGPPVPRELPADVYGFTGRAAALAELDALIGDAARRSAVVISAVSGTAGVGKTALAVHWAHQVADRFPDGQLYVDLRGYHPGQPMSPADVLAAFLDSLGVAAADIPLDVAGRAARYRTLLAGRRVLVLLDNAYSADQVRPLLPGAPSCVVVVTSRADLAGLVARDGARRIDLDILSPDEAVALLRTLIGDRVSADPVAAAVLAERCARLPLAIRVAAELAAARPTTPLADLVDDLRDQRRRLDLLDTGGDPHTAVRAVLSWSCRHLPPDVAHGFSLLGLHPGDAFDRYAVAALIGDGLDRARPVIDELTRAHLIEPRGGGRYGMHDLLRAYAGERAAAELDVEPTREALIRLFDHYVHTAAAAMSVAFGDDGGHGLGTTTTPAPPFGTPENALAWLDSERPNLVAVSTHAAEHGFAGHTGDLSQALWRYLDAHVAEALAVHTNAVRVAGDDPRANASALTNLGLVHWRLGRPRDAIDHLRRAVAGHRACGDRAGEARALGNLGLVAESTGEFAEALDHYQRVRDIHRETGDRRAELRLLTNLGVLYLRSGSHAEAVDHQRQAVALARSLGDRRSVGLALLALGGACEVIGDYREAAEHLTRALAICREFKDRRNEGIALGWLGLVHIRLDEPAAALDHHELALAISREVGDQFMETEALNAVGEALRAVRQPGRAADRHRTALTLARRTGDRPEQARALAGIALALHDTGDSAEAGRLWRGALAIFDGLGLPEAHRLRADLAALGVDAGAAAAAGSAAAVRTIR